MIPKIIHLCWVGGGKYPVEIRECIESWQRYLPDYEIKLWDRKAVLDIGCTFANEAMEAHKWAFAADAVRFYAVWKYGGIYMDSDILVLRHFDELIPEKGFATVHEHLGDKLQLQAAFFMGEKGNEFCRRCYEYYSSNHFLLPDGRMNMTISPAIMKQVAEDMGWKPVDEPQYLEADTIILPGHLVTPANHVKRHPDAIAQHRILGSWRKRKLGRRIEIAIKHAAHNLKYRLTHIGRRTILPGE